MSQVTNSEDKTDLLNGRQLRDLSCFVTLTKDLIIQAQEDSTDAYEVLFRRLQMFGIAVVNKHGDIIGVVAITIWPKKK